MVSFCTTEQVMCPNPLELTTHMTVSLENLRHSNGIQDSPDCGESYVVWNDISIVLLWLDNGYTAVVPPEGFFILNTVYFS